MRSRACSPVGESVVTFDLQMWAGQNAYFTFGSGTAGMRRVDVFNAENEEFHISTQFLDSALNIGWW